MCSASFTEWAGGAVFSSLIEMPAAIPDGSFSEWSAEAVLSGFPTGKRTRREEGGTTQRQENNVASPSPQNNNNLAPDQANCKVIGIYADEVLCPQHNIPNRKVKLKLPLAEADEKSCASSERPSFHNGIAGDEDDSYVMKRLGVICKEKMMQAAVVAESAVESDQNNGEQQEEVPLKSVNNKRGMVATMLQAAVVAQRGKTPTESDQNNDEQQKEVPLNVERRSMPPTESDQNNDEQQKEVPLNVSQRGIPPTESDQNNDEQQEEVPLKISNNKRGMLATMLQAAAVAHQDMPATESDQNNDEQQKEVPLKMVNNKIVMRAAAQCTDYQNDERQVSFKSETTKLDTKLDSVLINEKEDGRKRITDEAESQLNLKDKTRSYDEWARGVVFLGLLVEKWEAEEQIIAAANKPECETPFKDWAADIVFNGLNDKMEKPGSVENAESEIVDVSTQNGKSVDGSVQSENPAGVSIRSMRTMPAKNHKCVSFRDRDSLIFPDKLLTSRATSIALSEDSADLEMLLEEEETDIFPSLSETNNFNVGKSAGNCDFHYDESNSSLQPQCSEIEDNDIIDNDGSVGPYMCSSASSVGAEPNRVPLLRGVSLTKVLDDDDIINNDRSVGSYVCSSASSVGAEPNGFPLLRGVSLTDVLDNYPLAAAPHAEDCESDILSPRNVIEEERNSQRSLGHQLKSNIASEDKAQPVGKSSATEKDSQKPASLQYSIPKIIKASVTKKKADERVGLVFTDKRHKVILTTITSNSPFRRNTDLSVNDEVLVINGHRLKSAKKGAEFIKGSHGTLQIIAFKGSRPRESELEMLKMTISDCKDIQFVTQNSMVHVLRISGRFARSGKIKPGDICLSVNGIPVGEAERATELLREFIQEDHRCSFSRLRSEYDLDDDPLQKNSGSPGRLVIMLFFSMAKLRYKLAKRLSTNLPVTWNNEYDSCTVTCPSSQNTQPMLRIHNDGNCEDLIESPEDIDPGLLRDIQTFALTFYSHFQDSMQDLHEAIRHAIRDNEAIE